MDNFKDEKLTEEQKKEILKSSITTLVENYKMLLISNNNISKLDKEKMYSDLEHNVTIIEFMTKCNLDKGVLWEGKIEKK